MRQIREVIDRLEVLHERYVPLRERLKERNLTAYERWTPYLLAHVSGVRVMPYYVNDDLLKRLVDATLHHLDIRPSDNN